MDCYGWYGKGRMVTHAAQTQLRPNHILNCGLNRGQVLGCCFGGDGGVVTCGEGHVLFWKREGRFLVKKMGVFGRQGKAQTLVCCARLQEKVTRYANILFHLSQGKNQ